MAQTEWVVTLRNVEEELGQLAAHLGTMAGAFHALGMTEPYRLMSERAEKAWALRDSVRQASRAAIDEMYRATQQASANLVNAALAGASIASQESD